MVSCVCSTSLATSVCRGWASATLVCLVFYDKGWNLILLILSAGVVDAELIRAGTGGLHRHLLHAVRQHWTAKRGEGQALSSASFVEPPPWTLVILNCFLKRWKVFLFADSLGPTFVICICRVALCQQVKVIVASVEKLRERGLAGSLFRLFAFSLLFLLGLLCCLASALFFLLRLLRRFAPALLLFTPAFFFEKQLLVIGRLFSLAAQARFGAIADNEQKDKRWMLLIIDGCEASLRSEQNNRYLGFAKITTLVVPSRPNAEPSVIRIKSDISLRRLKEDVSCNVATRIGTSQIKRDDLSQLATPRTRDRGSLWLEHSEQCWR
ncbi:uncharacterized protein BDR25DRAFT_363274 [Lindgomyces ingoldianus]|uniref:Uncharacterized protein n=1 Tax=Lindgomyces ingoldianus TaxID=673940 RepID=A0ACB6Q9Y7_9PLEO|nr:uncharacterized protein BDR25DRAFT_363274 [Lindgomyces ingoldianus]KAF2462950.1 hypothetical protein BDR25DRAFT_363274 [Lindgomyces ingoldianus]